MFSGKRKKETERTAGIAEKVSIISEGVAITGDLNSAADIRIDGKVNGNVSCTAKVVITASGEVRGNIQAANIDIHGTVYGDVVAHDLLSLKASCHIDGNVMAKRMQMEPNAIFNGHCTMTDDRTVAAVTEEGLIFSEPQELK